MYDRRGNLADRRRNPADRSNPADAAAEHVAKAAKFLNGISSRYVGYEVANAATIRDLRWMAQFNDLLSVQMDAYHGTTSLATWVARVNHRGWTIEDPIPRPSDAVLCTLHFQLTVNRKDREHLYRHLLSGPWTPSLVRPDAQFHGVVRTLPVPGGRPGLIVSGQHRSLLRLKEASGLRVGQRVRYSVTRDRSARHFAHTIRAA